MDPDEKSIRTRGQGFSAPMDRDWIERLARRYAARWESSEAIVRSHLERKVHARCEASGEDPSIALESIPGVIERLVEAGYVNDHRFAAETTDRMRRAGRSKTHIDSRLRAKGISESIRRDLLQQGDDVNQESMAAWRLARRRRLGPYCENPGRRERERHRHLAIFARQGFDREIAERVIDAEAPLESF